MKKFKIQDSKFKILILLIIECLILNFEFAGTASAELTAVANHDHIKIDFFYHGSAVSVSGVSEPGVDLVIKITSPEGHDILKQKGKVAGLLWMNAGTLEFEKTPGLYLVHSSQKIESLLSREEMDRYVLGYPALENHIEIAPISKKEEKQRWFDEFVKYKESSNLYMNTTGRISTEIKGDKQFYYIKNDWPYQAPPGDYIVTVYAVKNKKVVETAEAKVLVEQVGIVKGLSGMAKSNGALYGVISIAAALAAGFGVGMIFRKGGGAH